MSDDFDPFDQGGTPAVSWTTVEDPDVIMPVGTKRFFEALENADWVQQHDFDTKEPAFWPLKDGETEKKPKMAAVVQVIEHEGLGADSPEKPHQHKGDLEQALWAGKAAKGATGALFNQIAAAQKAAKGKIGPRTLIQVELVDKKKDPAQPSKRAQNVFEAKVALNYYPARTKAAPAEDDPFSGGGSANDQPADGGSEEPPF